MSRPKMRNAETFRLIQQLLDQNKATFEIAQAIGCTPGTLRVWCCKAGVSLHRGRPRPRRTVRNPQHPIQCRLPPAIVINLENYAKKSGISRDALASRLLEQIARDDLYLAVLDDKEVL
jgi:transposase-like protein